MKKICLVLISVLLFSNLKSQIVSAKIDTLIKKFIKQAKIPGLSVSVSMGNKVIYSNAFGLQDVEQNVPATTDTKYRIGSLAKLFTATTFIKQISKGIFREDSKVSEFIPGLPLNYQFITLSQLASHTSGVRHYTRNEILTKNTVEYKKLEDGLSRFINDTLLFSPGEKYLYSSYGYILLGAALENITHESFNMLVQNEIFRPARMRATLPERLEDESSKSVFYYPANMDSLTIASGDNYSYKWPAGGYLSTPTDLVKFGSALLDEKIIDKQSLHLLFESKKTTKGKETGSGYGFRIGTDSRGRKVVHHGGVSEGARAFLLLYPDEKLSIAICANIFLAPLFEGEAETIAGYFLDDYISGQNILPSKQFNYTTTSNKKELKGKIVIDGNKGVIYSFNNADLPIIDVVYDKDKIRIIAASADGLINFWLTKDNSNYTGSWGHDKPATAITIE